MNRVAVYCWLLLSCEAACQHFNNKHQYQQLNGSILNDWSADVKHQNIYIYILFFYALLTIRQELQSKDHDNTRYDDRSLPPHWRYWWRKATTSTATSIAPLIQFQAQGEADDDDDQSEQTCTIEAISTQSHESYLPFFWSHLVVTFLCFAPLL